MPSLSPVRVVVGFDGSDDSLAALAYAAFEARSRQGTLHIVYAVDDLVLNSAWGIVFDVDAVTRAGTRLLERARELAIETGLPADHVHTESAVGQPGAVLARLSETAALAVVGRRAESGGESMFVGSTAVTLAGGAVCPVIVVSAMNEAAAPHHTPIVVGMDSSGGGAVAVDWALLRAARLGVGVSVISIVTRPPGRLFLGALITEEHKRAALDQARERIERLVRPKADAVPAVEVTIEVLYGSPVEELVAQSETADLLIIGVHPAFPTYGVGGTVRAIMAHARCPLGLVRHR